MRKAVIWDLDGTLLDSYGIIVESLYLSLREAGVYLSREEIRLFALQRSIEELLSIVAEKHNISLERLHVRHREISGGMVLCIQPMKHALEILHQLNAANVENYVYTHRGATTIPVLDNLSMTGCFKEILTSQSGFARKPAPDAIRYLMDKYDLKKENTFYVGDRSLDMNCAKNAGITGIFFAQENVVNMPCDPYIYQIHDLLEVMDIVK